MSHMLFDAKLIETLKMDGEVKGPSARWQKNGKNLSSLNVQDENSFSCTPSTSKSFCESKSPSRGKSPSRSKSPGNTSSLGKSMPKLSVRSSGSKTPNGKTPSKLNQSDRFIPNRSTTDMERAHHLVVSYSESGNEGCSDDSDPSHRQREYQEKMEENLNGNPVSNRILSFSSKPPEASADHVNNLKVLYSAGKTLAPKSSSSRHIPSAPERILDAPELLDDYYLHLLDWSMNNHLAVALGGAIYIWNAGDGGITGLVQFDEPEHVCSLSWIKEGNVLAVGLSTGKTQLWDVGQQKLIRTMGGHEGRITTLSWNSFILSSGSRSGQIIHHDVRVASHISATLSHHTQEVCGLKWSCDGRYLASGGNDNLICIWEKENTTSPLHILTRHQAAVKALAWCPWQSNILASGGGTNDRSIKLWNCSSGACLKEVRTNSQVASILWSSHYKELISGHGFSQNQLTLWKYPTFAKIVDLTGHTGRVLELCLSPDGETVVSAAADETIRMWKCWAVDKKKKTIATCKGNLISALSGVIR